MKQNENELLISISKYIRELGIPVHFKGYQYLRTAIMLGITDRASLNSFTKGIYPMVAKYHDTTPVRVERAIRGSIEYAWKHNQDKINALRGYTSATKPTNSEFISIVVENMTFMQIEENVKGKFKCIVS